ncbi:unnamed protein product [Sympodiomycopsis kandeliae]
MATSTAKHHVLVVGGAGFLGSAITKRLLAKGHMVTSMSPSGRAFLTPSGHSPAWSSLPSIRWARGDAFTPSTYQKMLTGEDVHPGAENSQTATPVTAVVSTIGVLLEGNYKGSSGSWEDVGKALLKGWGMGSEQNPLLNNDSNGGGGMYEKMNRDAVINVAETFLSTLPSSSRTSAAPFVFISAEDIFRPIIDPRYISTKRQAEAALERLSWSTSSTPPSSSVIPDSDGAGLESELNTSPKRILRPTYLRPGLMYHPHTRPLSTLPSAILDLSSKIHSMLPNYLPTPANILKTLGQESLSNLLLHSPLHIDTVAKAAEQAIIREEVSGPKGVEDIKALAGFKNNASTTPPQSRKPWPTQSQSQSVRS